MDAIHTLIEENRKKKNKSTPNKKMQVGLEA
jgi:hypothetical protein